MARRKNRHPAESELGLKRVYWPLVIVAALAVAWWVAQKRTALPRVRFIKASRETLVSNLPTNAKVEPIEWSAVRVDAAGLVTKLPVHLGQRVTKGALLAQLNAVGLTEQLAAGQARTAQIQAELDTLTKGGRSSELQEIENNLVRARFDRDTEAKEYGSLKRLYDKQAATLVEVETARDKLRESEIEIESLGRRRAALVGKNDISGTEARLREARAAEQLTRAKMGQGAIRSPMAGEIYSLPARLGSYLNAGDLVAAVGRLDKLKIRVYVDEPELGRVAVGQPVKITWDALPGKSWQGKVERMPTEIVPLGTRQVGEVLCSIDNPGRELVPGTNVNADIQTNVVENALTIPKEALHRDGGKVTVYTLEGTDRVRVKDVQLGIASVTRVQIMLGLQDGEAVALPGDTLLKDGEQVKAEMQ